MKVITVPCLLVIALICMGVGPASHLDPKQIAGVYKTHFPNWNTAGDQFVSENKLEVVILSPLTAYISVDLTGGNAHNCSVSGVARVNNDLLVYRDPKPIVPEWPPCVLTIRVKHNKVLLGDHNGNCHKIDCGTRAFIDGYSFPLSGRRPIRYMSRLLRSSEYKAALAEQAGTPSLP